MIEEHYVAQGLSVVGYFLTNERFDDLELCGIAKNIDDHISRYFPHASILLVNIPPFFESVVAFLEPCDADAMDIWKGVPISLNRPYCLLLCKGCFQALEIGRSSNGRTSQIR